MNSNDIPWLRNLLRQATEDGSRSTALKPIAQMTAILGSITVSSLYVHAPSWLIALLGVSCALSVTLYLFAYLYLLFKDRDSLRSERYTIQKLAIERGYVGDSTTGVIDLDAKEVPRALSSPNSGDVEETQHA